MRISTIALANLRRRMGKAAFLAFGIAIGIGTAIALFTLTTALREEVGSQLDRFGANIVVVPKSNTLALNYGGIAVSGVSYDESRLTTADIDKIRSIPYRQRLSVVAPKLLTSLDADGRHVLVAGVDFASELKLKRWWRISGTRPQTGTDVLVGFDVARALSLVAGVVEPNAPHRHGEGQDQTTATLSLGKDRVTLAGRPFRAVGVIGQTGGPEDQMVFADLAKIQELIGKPGEVSLIEVSALCKDCPVGDIVAQIAGQLPNAKTAAIQQAVRARNETVDRLTRFSAVIAAVVLGIGALMVFTTMMGAVVERTKEIGVLRAIGFRKVHIVQELMIEVLVISVVGGLAGWLIGVTAGWAALPYFSETGVRLAIHPGLAAAAVLMAVAVGTISAIYPALRASKLDPSEAVRYV